MSQNQFKIIDAMEWLKSDPPVPDSVLEGLFDTGDKVCIIGGPKMRKTWYCLQLAISIWKGIPFLGFSVPKPRSVLLVQSEVKEGHFHSRFRHSTKAIGLTDGLTKLQIINARGIKLTEAHLLDAARTCSAEVIILDPLYKLIEGDENSAQDMKVVLSMFDRIAEQTNATIVYTHHDGKGNAGSRDTRDRGAGSNVLARDYDCCITLTPHEQHDLQVAQFLLRNYPEKAPCTIEWNEYLFSLSDATPIVRQQNSGNPTTAMPEHKFYSALEIILKRSRWKNQSGLIEELRNEVLVTKDKAKKIILSAVDDERIVTNHGKRLNRKQNIYALSKKDLDFAITSLHEKGACLTSSKQK